MQEKDESLAGQVSSSSTLPSWQQPWGPRLQLAVLVLGQLTSNGWIDWAKKLLRKFQIQWINKFQCFGSGSSIRMGKKLRRLSHKKNMGNTGNSNRRGRFFCKYGHPSTEFMRHNWWSAPHQIYALARFRDTHFAATKIIAWTSSQNYPFPLVIPYTLETVVSKKRRHGAIEWIQADWMFEHHRVEQFSVTGIEWLRPQKKSMFGSDPFPDMTYSKDGIDPKNIRVRA